MKVKDLVQELEDKDCYKNFKEKYPDLFFSAGFFILDLQEKSEQLQLDYFLPNEQKLAAFEFPFGEPKIHDDEIEKATSQTLEIKIDIDDLENKSLEIIKENESDLKPTKIISILKDDVWNLTCMNDVLGIVRIKINAVTGELIDFSKGSLMDFMGIKKK